MRNVVVHVCLHVRARVRFSADVKGEKYRPYPTQKCILAVDNFLNDWVKIFCVLSMLPNPCRTNTSAEADHKEEHNMEVVTLNLWWVQVLQFSLRSSIAFCALLVQHCSVSRTKCFHCFLAVLCFVMAILYVNRRFYVSDSWCKILAWGSWNYELVRILLINWIRDWFLARMVYSTLCALSVFIWWRKILAWGCWNWACSNTLDQWDCR